MTSRESSSRSRSRSASRHCSAKRSRSNTPEVQESSYESDDDRRYRKKKVKKESYRRSMETKIDNLTNALAKVQQMMVENQSGLGPALQPNEGNQVGGDEVVIAAESETTIYKNAVQLQNDAIGGPHLTTPNQDIVELLPKRFSNSSDEPIDTSDELFDEGIDNLISGARKDAAVVHGEASTSAGGRRRLVEMAVPEQKSLTHAEQMIRDSENTKAKMLATPGTYNDKEISNFVHSAFVDEEYLAIGSHLDETICRKIVNHEYVDFSKLLPRDKISNDDDLT